MRISKLRIENYRAFEDETIDFGQFTCLVGMNGAGKSTVLNALNTLFQEKGGATDPARLAEEDFHKRNVDRRIAITATFVDVPPDAAEELKGRAASCVSDCRRGRCRCRRSTSGFAAGRQSLRSLLQSCFC